MSCTSHTESHSPAPSPTAVLAPAVARTGKQLVALLRNVPLDGVALAFDRDRSLPRAAVRG